MLTTYARAALPLVPGASRLPFVAGGGGDVPTDLVRERRDVRVEIGELRAYAEVCGFDLAGTLPPTYPHVLAFPLHLQLMADGRFPFAPVGLVHIANAISVHRPIRTGEPLDVRVHPSAAEPHPKGRSFSLLTEVSVAGEPVWTSSSTMLRRGGGQGGGQDGGERATPPPATEQWTVEGDLGRRYAGVSGDQNPIHLHPLSARLFGFPRAIAHGMWTKARCLAALEHELPDAYAVEVRFGKPILLPGEVGFGAARDGGRTRFAVRSGEDRIHLEGEVTGR